MRIAYSLLFLLLTPLMLARLAWRGIKAPAYWYRWGERFGLFTPPGRTGGIWIHAVSVGETQAAAPLIRALLDRYPELPLAITTTTPTGSQRVRELFGNEVFHTYAPFDLPFAVKRFLTGVRPRLVVVMETELWPNLFHYSHLRNIPLIVANARLSRRSAHGYARIPWLIGPTLDEVTLIAAQGQLDAERFLSLGLDEGKLQVTGSIKFDIKLPASLLEQAEVLRRDLGTDRPVWIAASTHEGEDEQILDTFDQLRHVLPNALLVLVPRHPERFAKAAELARDHGHKVRLRSERKPCAAEVAVFVGDSMGELPLFYAAADVAFVGGSLIPHGGHNPLEPAALGVPVLFGPHMFNFEEIAELLLEAGAARQIADKELLAANLLDWLQDANGRDDAGARGRRAVDANRGAMQRLLALIEGQLERRQETRPDGG